MRKKTQELTVDADAEAEISAPGSHLTTQEMCGARLLLDKENKQGAIAKELGVSERTLSRWIKRPEFIAYQNQVRAEQDKKLAAKTDAALKKIDFSKSDAVEALVNIVKTDGGPPSAASQIKAIEVLATLLGWVPSAVGAGAQDQPAEPKPTFYRSAWREPIEPVQ